MTKKYNIIPLFDTFAKGIVAENEDDAIAKLFASIRTPEQLKEYVRAIDTEHRICRGQFITTWDTNEFDVTDCKIDMETREIISVEPSDKNISGTVVDEYVRFANGSYRILAVDDDSKVPTDENILWYRKN